VEGVRGHPGALLSGWAEGASGPELAALIGAATVAAVVDLAGQVWRRLRDDVIEWAVVDGEVWLLQSQRSGAVAHGAVAALCLAATGPADAVPVRWAGGLPAARASMPLLAATVLRRGEHVPGRPGAPGTAAGRLLACRPHECPAGACQDAILLVDRPLPALAPLLFAARGVIARTGAAGSHLAGVARSLGVPMVLGCRPERVTGTPAVRDGAFLAAIDGTTGDVALLPATGGWPVGGAEPGSSALSGLHHPASVRPPRDRAASEARWRTWCDGESLASAGSPTRRSHRRSR